MPPRTLLEWVVGQRVPTKKGRKASSVKVKLATNDETEEDTITVTVPRHGSAARKAAERTASKNVRFDTKIGGDFSDEADDEKSPAPKNGNGNGAVKARKKKPKPIVVIDDSDATLIPEESQAENSEVETGTQSKSKNKNKGKGGGDQAKAQNNDNKDSKSSEKAEGKGGDKKKGGKGSSSGSKSPREDKTKSSTKQDSKPSPKSTEKTAKNSPKSTPVPYPAPPASGVDPNLILPVQAYTINVEHAFEEQGKDPKPNAFFDPHSGRCRVYHGPEWGIRYKELYPQATAVEANASAKAPSPPKSPREMQTPSKVSEGPPPVPAKPAEYQTQPEPLRYYMVPQQSEGHGQNQHHGYPQYVFHPQPPPIPQGMPWANPILCRKETIPRSALSGPPPGVPLVRPCDIPFLEHLGRRLKSGADFGDWTGEETFSHFFQPILDRAKANESFAPPPSSPPVTTYQQFFDRYLAPLQGRGGKDGGSSSTAKDKRKAKHQSSGAGGSGSPSSREDRGGKNGSGKRSKPPSPEKSETGEVEINFGELGDWDKVHDKAPPAASSWAVSNSKDNDKQASNSGWGNRDSNEKQASDSGWGNNETSAPTGGHPGSIEEPSSPTGSKKTADAWDCNAGTPKSEHSQLGSKSGGSQKGETGGWGSASGSQKGGKTAWNSGSNSGDTPWGNTSGSPNNNANDNTFWGNDEQAGGGGRGISDTYFAGTSDKNPNKNNNNNTASSW
ncbi:hypothetical protein B0T14DRAFT_173107 [Immersiella caudata]|uniref:Uncharacterized protein n=1 Tax=Immersiella caudata TaxID=314043 RepID=A0AA39WX97_9PEZI|nr:hypothetical protein B0T14DRAFT_173107 [Immersiella caudata]